MYCVIMAGGSGTRFWPRSKEGKSKQFLSLFSHESLIRTTVNRYRGFITEDKIYIILRKDQKAELEKHISDIPAGNIILEPQGRNTAPCIGLAALFIEKRDPDGVMIVSPADHLIQDDRKFQEAIEAAVNLAENTDAMITIGIKPDRPATGYGYIQIGKPVKSPHKVIAYTIRKFTEKPDIQKARRFLKSGDFFWNSGIFVFRASLFLKALEEFQPDLYENLMDIRPALETPDLEAKVRNAYQRIHGIAVDYAIMEKAKNLYLVRGEFFWSDLGSWDQVYQLCKKDLDGNVSQGNVLFMDTKKCYAYSSGGVIVLAGTEDLVVVQEGDSLLVCKRGRTEDVKKAVELMKQRNWTRYL